MRFLFLVIPLLTCYFQVFYGFGFIFFTKSRSLIILNWYKYFDHLKKFSKYILHTLIQYQVLDKKVFPEN